MKSVRLALAALFLSLLVTSPVAATSFTTDESDLWEADPPGSEDGWGMQLVQRGSVIFATIYVYGPSTSPTWYVATMNPTATQFQWSGDLYATTGPWFGTVPFNPANVVATKVGTIVWTALAVWTSTVFYTVNGVAVSKNVIREQLVFDNFSGHYIGGIHADTTSCVNTANNGTVEGAAVLEIAQNGQAITVSFTGSGGNCSLPGTLFQQGQMGYAQGSFVCSDGSAGTFVLREMQVNISSFSGRFTLTNSNPPGCQSTGWFGGMRGTTF